MTDTAPAPSTAAPAQDTGAISDQQKQLVRDSFQMLEPAGELIGQLFYRKLLDVAPDIEPIFSGNIGEQQHELVSVLRLAIGSLDRLDELVPALQLLGVKLRGYGVRPVHYGAFGEALLWTLAHALKDQYTPETQDAWVAVYSLMAELMASAE